MLQSMKKVKDNNLQNLFSNLPKTSNAPLIEKKPVYYEEKTKKETYDNDMFIEKTVEEPKTDRN